MTRSAKRMSFILLPDRNAAGVGETLHLGQKVTQMIIIYVRFARVLWFIGVWPHIVAHILWLPLTMMK